MGKNIVKIENLEFHRHMRNRMLQRGVTKEEVVNTFNDGWNTSDAKAGTIGKTKAFPYRKDWEGTFYEEKEVSLYYKIL